ncbi:MAG: SufD family Fe-S cluster assembly protein [Bacteroidales bacterium]|nr:SufD family Fe-S cluster assembly protein [Bacteroidales bacterium]
MTSSSMGHGKYIDPFRSFVANAPQDDKKCHSEGHFCHSERSEESIYTVAAGERLLLEFTVLPGESRDVNVAVDLVGPGAELSLKALYLCGSDEKVNFRILVHHRAPGCRSTQLVKGIAGGNSNVTFNGTIVVAPDAQKTEAFQENHNILFSERAKVETRPQLEIYADDVKCSHGATVGRLNEDELFYMRSRGISKDEAEALQMLSFLSPVIPEGREEEIEKAIRSL